MALPGVLKIVGPSFMARFGAHTARTRKELSESRPSIYHMSNVRRPMAKANSLSVVRRVYSPTRLGITQMGRERVEK